MENKKKLKTYVINDRYSYKLLIKATIKKILGYKIVYSENSLEVALGIVTRQSTLLLRKIVWYMLKKMCYEHDYFEISHSFERPIPLKNLNLEKYKKIYFIEQVLCEAFSPKLEKEYYQKLIEKFDGKLIRVIKPVYQSDIANQALSGVKSLYGVKSIPYNDRVSEDVLFISVYSSFLLDKTVKSDRVFLIPSASLCQNITNRDKCNIEKLQKLTNYNSQKIIASII
jgi:hypothetical protein